MSQSYTATGCTNHDQLLSLVNEAIISPSPPLSVDAQNRISTRETLRLSKLEGATRFEAEKIFAALKKVPPCFSDSLASYLRCLSDTDFTYVATHKAVTEWGENPENSIRLDNESFGYSHPIATVEGEDLSQKVFSIDSFALQNQAEEYVKEIYRGLSLLGEKTIRITLIRDCIFVLNQRKDFDFSNSPLSDNG